MLIARFYKSIIQRLVWNVLFNSCSPMTFQHPNNAMVFVLVFEPDTQHLLVFYVFKFVEKILRVKTVWNERNILY